MTDLRHTLASTAATCVIHIAAIVMVIVMLRNIRTKYTAIGRQEISLFFTLFLIEEMLNLVIDSAIIPASTVVYPWLVSVHIGLVLSMTWCLLVNGIVNFQLWEDGTPQSILFIYSTTATMFGASFFLSALTFHQWAPNNLSSTKTTPLFVVHMVAPGSLVLLWLLSQLWLVFTTIDTLWPLGDLFLAVGFYLVGVAIMLGISADICERNKHYVDGLSFGVLSILLAIMMVYKFWDAITKDDMDFSLGQLGTTTWKVNDPVFGPTPPHVQQGIRFALPRPAAVAYDHPFKDKPPPYPTPGLRY